MPVDPAPVRLGGKTSNHGTATAKARMTIDLGDFYFGPTFIKVKPGQRFSALLENTGTYPHTFSSVALNLDIELAPGQRKTVTLTGPTDGSSVYYCRFHQAMGMQGAMFVR